jgi:AcrR family transcriptional regulator
VRALEVTVKGLRSDAQRNRDRIVASARALFASDGVDASVEEITCRAGVGMGTLYRHFPTKEELIDAVLEDAYGDLVALAESSLAEPDGWGGLRTFLEGSLEMQARNRGLKAIVVSTDHGRERAAAMRGRLAPLLERLVRRGQEEGSLRGDVTPEDVWLLLWGGGGVIDRTGSDAEASCRRYVALALNGFRVRPPAGAPA